VTAQAADRPIFLVGFMGSGKTSVAREIAARLGWEFADIDEQVERREGRTIERIFAESGEARFRDAEREALFGLDGVERSVVATGGGLPCAADLRRWIRARGRGVWLDVPLAECMRRVGGAAGRPLWQTGDPLALRVLYERRRAVYALTGLRVAGGLGSARETARAVIGRLAAGGDFR